MEDKYKKEDEMFDEKFSPEWWKGFGTTNDIDRQGIDGIKSFIHQILDQKEAEKKEALEGQVREIKDLIPLYLAGELQQGETSQERDGRNKVLKEFRDLLTNYLQR
jgi:hypothetical protein